MSRQSCSSAREHFAQAVGSSIVQRNPVEGQNLRCTRAPGRPWSIKKVPKPTLLRWHDARTTFPRFGSNPGVEWVSIVMKRVVIGRSTTSSAL